ncbi:TPA: hypothetical protein VDT98_005904 [Pseudomonas aeruginosa]|nr:hypothetical protein [Pseudomonas aeruginosa]
MSESMHGTVTLVVGARTFTLQPTLEAALRIETRFGGLRPALDALRTFSIAACADIVVAGAGLKPEEHTTLATQVFETGVVRVSAQLIDYITGLLSPVPPSIAERGKPGAASTAP